MYFQGEVTGEILRFLTFRLDFNDYHTSQHDNGSRSPGRPVGVSPMTHQTAGGRTGSAFTFQNSDLGSIKGRQAVAIQLDQDYSPGK